MDDKRVWAFEEDLWRGGEETYRTKVDGACLMVLPEPPFVLSGAHAIAAVADTPRWKEVDFSEQQVSRPQEGLIVVAYRIRASRGEESYEAYCTSTYRQISHEDWQVVQHQQAIATQQG